MQVSIKVKDCVCPKCGAEEVHPADVEKPTMERRLVIRGFKVYHKKHWWSQCLRCSGFYDADLNETPDNHDGQKGWF